ncbi:permease [Alsobacter metallidurans]|uniref:Permease n=1 Tax=Alsobacter metallidurans TaxID=340221 RepID=A0A917IB89_9HYPH|nr:ABC transporter permease [Alsobacter metallidurans]GGH33184.1 permease [Alsobacter metallidurans]
MTLLDRKLLRDLWSLRAQVITIALLIGAGVTVLVGSVGTYTSLVANQDRFYDDARFAQVWAEVERAPRSVVPRLSEIPGVGVVEARVIRDVRLDWPQSALSVAGRIVALPSSGQTALNRLTLERGRWFEPGRSEVLVSAGFAETWSVQPGDPIRVILNGRLQTFSVAGIAYSPEFVYASRPGNPLPDDRTFAVLWADEDAVAAAFDLKGAFNAVAATLAPGASEKSVLAAVDAVLDRYGGRGGYGRRDQPSHRFLSDELAEQRTLALTVPTIFFGIAAFLLNIVLARLVEAQREQIAALKALGFPSRPIAMHYLKFVVVLCALGCAGGVAMGVWYGHGMLNNYRPFFRFPALIYEMPAPAPLIAVLLSVAAGSAGALAAVRRVLALRPAEAMRPAAPAAFSRAALGRRWRPTTKMALRGLAGRPVRSVLSVLGLAMAVPMIVMGLFWWDALAFMIAVQFEGVDRADAVVSFTDPVAGRAAREIAAIPGVLAVEGQRVVPVRLRAGPRDYRVGLTGLSAGAQLRVPREQDLRRVPVRPDGLTLTRGLAERLGVGVGSAMVVEALDGKRPAVAMPVVALADELLGFNAYLDIDALNRLMREGDRISQAAIRVDPARASAIWRSLSERPRVAAVAVKSVWLQVFDEKIAGMVVVSAVVLTLFGLIIAVGVVYNSARIGLQERAWELASLRVLGFTRGEASGILLAELAVQMLIAIPIGLVLARQLVATLLELRDNESFQIPVVISAPTYATATLTVAFAALGCALLVRRRVDRLDLVAALKTRE